MLKINLMWKEIVQSPNVSSKVNWIQRNDFKLNTVFEVEEICFIGYQMEEIN